MSDYKLLIHTVRDFSMLKDNSKRLLCSITQERDFYAQSQKKETSKQLQRIEKVWILDIQSEVFTIQYKQNRLCFSRHLRILGYELL